MVFQDLTFERLEIRAIHKYYYGAQKSVAGKVQRLSNRNQDVKSCKFRLLFNPEVKLIKYVKLTPSTQITSCLRPEKCIWKKNRNGCRTGLYGVTPPMTFQTKTWGVYNSNPLSLVIITLQYEEILWTGFGEITRSNFSKNSIFFCKKCFFLIDNIHIKWIGIVWQFKWMKNCFVPPTQKFKIHDISKCLGGNKILRKNWKSAWNSASNAICWFNNLITGTKVLNEIHFSTPTQLFICHETLI